MSGKHVWPVQAWPRAYGQCQRQKDPFLVGDNLWKVYVWETLHTETREGHGKVAGRQKESWGCSDYERTGREGESNPQFTLGSQLDDICRTNFFPLYAPSPSFHLFSLREEKKTEPEWTIDGREETRVEIPKCKSTFTQTQNKTVCQTTHPKIFTVLTCLSEAKIKFCPVGQVSRCCFMNQFVLHWITYSYSI